MVENKDLLEVRLHEDDDFLKIKETLTRIGIANQRTKTLYQTAHILHKQGKYYIVHFKELYKLDGRETTLTDSDLSRRTAIALLLAQWGLCDIVRDMTEEERETVLRSLKTLKVLSFGLKKDWMLKPKYAIGVRHH